MRTFLVGAAALVTLAMAGCASPVSDPGTSGTGVTDVRGEWTLVAGADGSGALELPDFPITVEFTQDNARVRTGCYSFDQPLNPALDVETIALGDSTVASCLAMSEDATAAIESLAGVSAADRIGDTLVLESGDYELEFELVPAVAATDVVGSWTLRGILWGDVASMVPDGPTITLAEDGTVSGSTGCADFTGSYRIVSGTNTVSDLVIDPATCPEEFVAVDQDIRATLQGGFLVHAADGTLTLVSAASETTLMYDPAA